MSVYEMSIYEMSVYEVSDYPFENSVTTFTFIKKPSDSRYIL